MNPSPLLAIIDMGTNTFHLLIAEATPDAPPQVRYQTKIPVKLGQGGISQGYLAEPAIARALATLGGFRATLAAYGVPEARVLTTATSAVRSAHNQQEFVRRVYESTGLRVQVISGEEEAALIYEGMRRGVALGRDMSLLVDIGGGSVELMLGNAERLFWKDSFEIGGQRLMDRFMDEDPIAPAAVERLEFFLEETLLPLTNAVHQYAPVRLVGASGTFDTLVEMYLARTGQKADPQATEFVLPLPDFRQLGRDLLAHDRAARLAMPGMIAMRADMIVVAVCLIRFLLDRYDLPELRTSRYALKEGLLYRALGQP